MNDGIGLGIDIGGTGTKAALVDLRNGQVVSERLRAPTPRPATQKALVATVTELVGDLLKEDPGAVGMGFPGVVRRGVALTSVNLSDEWLYADLGRVFEEALGRHVWALNDADAAALAEARFGAGRHHEGTIVVLTLGTGVGTSLIVDHHLIPNIELGCLSVRGKPAGERVANSVRERRKLSWRAWAADLELFIERLDEAVAPDLIIFGGGVSEEAGKFLPLIKARPLLLPARLRNIAGLAGAAAFAGDQVRIRSADPSARVGTITETVLTEDVAHQAKEGVSASSPVLLRQG